MTSAEKVRSVHWSGVMAGALMAAPPPVTLYVFLIDYYISSPTTAATKG